MPKDIYSAREDFPILQSKVFNRPLVYLDSAATMQMPRQVMREMEEQHSRFHANVHRGIHYLSEKSTARMESVRETVRAFINAQDAGEIVFTSGTTQSLNLLASSFCKAFIGEGDEIIVSAMEHHSNFVPWQQACLEKGAAFKILPFDENGELELDKLPDLLTPKTRLISITYVSNVLGTVNPVAEIIRLAHSNGTLVMLDCAQAMRHVKIDVQQLDCDFLCFSGHKIGGPTGTGVLYGKMEWLKKLPPSCYGGGMVDRVTMNGTTFTEPPLRFESGTPNITGIIGLGTAVDYLESLGVENISAYEKQLLCHVEEMLRSIPEIRVLGAPAERAGVISFNINGLHCFDTAEMLDKLGIAVRSGHHCAQPLLDCYGLEGTVRVSPAFYNTHDEIDILGNGLQRIADIARRIRK